MDDRNRKILFYGVLAIIGVGLFILANVLSAFHIKQNTAISVVTPTPVTTAKQQYISSDNSYALTYPSTWTPVTKPNDPVVNISYADNNKQYQFTISPPGQINVESPDNGGATVSETDVSYGGKVFVKRIWSTQGVLFFIAAVPKDYYPNSHVFSMQLPPNNTDKYVKLFDEIMLGLKL